MPIGVGAVVDGRYEVQRFLGSGTFGEVYQVQDYHQGAVVALKLLNPVGLGAWPWHESTQLTRLRSDYILPIWNADVVSGLPYIVSDVATGGTLGDVFNNGPIPVPAAVRAVREAARGVGRAHDDAIVHRDIKPDNLFLAAAGHVMVGDFGLAHPLDSAGHAPPGGTPATSAPEVVAGGPTSIASDVYSLGATLYALVAGRWPYDEHKNDVAAHAAAVAAGPPARIRDIAPHISRSLQRVIEKAMARNPADRYTTAGFDAALGRVTCNRTWIHEDHRGHQSCWTARHRSGELAVCVAPNATRFDIVVFHNPSGRRIRQLCAVGVGRAQLPGRLRRIFENLGN